MIKNYLRPYFLWLRVAYGFIFFKLTKITPPSSYQALIRLFCITGGKSNDLISNLISTFCKPYKFENKNGILGEIDSAKRKEILSKLKQDGYYVFENALPENICNNLLNFALNQPSTLRPMDDQIGEKPSIEPYNRNSPKTVRYSFATQDLLNNIEIQNLLTDMSLIAVAQDYLGTKPILDVLSMWWHTSFSSKPDKEAAQYFHFDMDRIKWLKVFIYLTDVTPKNGPHTFVVGSHKTNEIPKKFLEFGYARLEDEDVISHFGKEKIIEFSAPKGTIIIEDTRGLHKGKHVEADDRLILQLQFSNSLFGGYYPKANFSENITPGLSRLIQKYKHIYSAYIK